MLQLLETIKVDDEQAYHLKYHQARLERSCSALGWRLDYKLHQLIKPPSKALFRCRFVYDEEGYNIEYLPYQAKKIQSLKSIHADTLNYELKYADRSALDELCEEKENADDILIIKDNLLTDTSVANIAFFDGHSWLTPKEPLLKGSTRARLLEKKKLKLADITLEEAKKYKRFALMNAMIGFVEIQDGIIL